jgi:hypothetical protein
MIRFWILLVFLVPFPPVFAGEAVSCTGLVKSVNVLDGKPFVAKLTLVSERASPDPADKQFLSTLLYRGRQVATGRSDLKEKERAEFSLLIEGQNSDLEGTLEVVRSPTAKVSYLVLEGQLEHRYNTFGILTCRH